MWHWQNCVCHILTQKASCYSHSHRELEGSPGQPELSKFTTAVWKRQIESINGHKPAVKSVWPPQTTVTVHRADFMSCRQQAKLCLTAAAPSPTKTELSWNFNGTVLWCHSFHTLHKHKIPRIGPYYRKKPTVCLFQGTHLNKFEKICLIPEK